MDIMKEKAKQVKMKILAKIEERLTVVNIDGAEIKALCEAINLIDEEKDLYMKTMLDILKNSKNFENNSTNKLPENACENKGESEK